MSQASDDLKIVNKLLEDPKVVAAGGATYKGKFVKFGDLSTIKNDLDKVVGKETKAAGKVKKTLAEAQGDFLSSLKLLNDYINGSPGYQATVLPGVPKDEVIIRLQKRASDAVSGLKTLNPNDPLLVKAGLAEALPPTSTGGAALKGGTQDVKKAEPTVIAPKAGVTTTPVVPPPAGTGDGGAVVVDPAKRKTFVDTELTKRGLADTPANRATLRKEFNTASQPVSAQLTPAIEEAFKIKYPQYAWMLTDLDRTKYSDMFQLIADASNPVREMPAEEFKRRFEGTSFTQELGIKKLNRELIGSIGSFSWGTGQLGKFLNKANQYGYTGESLKQAAYQELLVKDPITKTYKNPNAVEEVRASSPYLRLKKIGTSYLSPLSDDRIIESLTGGIAEDDVLRITREKAKALYPHLSKQIDAGLTLSDLAYDYQRTAADLLETTPEQIDMTKGKFGLALKTGEGGKERMMSTSEWIQTIKSDDDFGWQYTKQANDQATNIALSIAKAFGKVK